MGEQKKFTPTRKPAQAPRSPSPTKVQRGKSSYDPIAWREETTKEKVDKLRWQINVCKPSNKIKLTRTMKTYITYLKKNIFNGEKLKAFPLKSETRQVCPISPLLHNIVLEVLDTAEKKKKYRTSDWKEIKLLQFADDKFIYLDNPKKYTGKSLEVINEYSKVSGYKIIREIPCIPQFSSLQFSH